MIQPYVLVVLMTISHEIHSMRTTMSARGANPGVHVSGGVWLHGNQCCVLLTDCGENVE